MKLTEFGKIVRKARLDANISLLEMATDLGVTSPYLSALETGRKKITQDWALKIQQYLQSKGVGIDDLNMAAEVSNQSINIEGLTPAHQMLMAGFARISPDEALLLQLQSLLAAANSGKDK